MEVNPKISVLMGVHNADLFILREAVESILNQSYQNFEFIIVDDINSNEVSEYLVQLTLLDSRIHLIKNNLNMGLTKSLCKATEIATGVLFARQDSDDVSELNRFKEQIDKFVENPHLVLVGTWYTLKFVNGRVRSYHPNDDNKEIRKTLYHNNSICHSSAMFKKSAYDQVGGYDPNYITTQDLDLWFRLVRVGFVGFVTKELVKRTLYRNSMSLSKKTFLQLWNGLKIRWRERSIYPGYGASLVIILGSIKHLISIFYLFFKQALRPNV